MHLLLISNAEVSGLFVTARSTKTPFTTSLVNARAYRMRTQLSLCRCVLRRPFTTAMLKCFTIVQWSPITPDSNCSTGSLLVVVGSIVRGRLRECETRGQLRQHFYRHDVAQQTFASQKSPNVSPVLCCSPPVRHGQLR